MLGTARRATARAAVTGRTDDDESGPDPGEEGTVVLPAWGWVSGRRLNLHFSAANRLDGICNIKNHPTTRNVQPPSLLATTHLPSSFNHNLQTTT